MTWSYCYTNGCKNGYINFVVYCHLFPHICIILVVITNVLNAFGDFLNNPLSSGFNSVLQKRPSFSIFDFPGVTGLGIEQTQSPGFGNFETDDMELLKEEKGAGKRERGPVAHPTPLGTPPGVFRPFEARFASIFVPPTWFDLKTSYIRVPDTYREETAA